jgi:hypothetical protein
VTRTELMGPKALRPVAQEQRANATPPMAKMCLMGPNT